MNGKMKITILNPINYPLDLEEDKYTAFVRKMLDIEILPGVMTDPDVLKFNFTIIELTSEEINIKFNWVNPLDISQNEPPERVKVTANLAYYVDLNGLALEKDPELITFVPR